MTTMFGCAAIAFGLIAAAAGCAPVTGSGATVSHQAPVGFTQAQFAQLRFLEGRWSGRAPDGSTFYEEYDFPEPGRMRSRRFTDASFAVPGDGSSVVLEGGAILSRWGDYSWRAAELSDGFVQFEPVNAPSRFSWRRIGPDRVDVVQQWTDAQGVAQSYTVPLTRITGR